MHAKIRGLTVPLQNQILLIDGHAAIYRSFHAIRDLTNPEGEPVNALYGMARFSLKLDQDFPSRYAALVMDKGKCARRLELLEQYKANRPSMPDDLREQIPLIRQWFGAMGWPLLEEEGKEADDLIALAVRHRDKLPVLIVSHDKDLAQLVDDNVQLVQSGGKGTWLRLGPEEVTDKFGVPPERIGDYLALVGDSSDNIPGIEGIGPKTAATLLREHGSIDNILKNLEQIKRESIRAKLADSHTILQLNRDLVRLDSTDSDQWPGLQGLQRRKTDWDRLLDIARQQGFKSLADTLEKGREEARNPRLF